MKHLIGFAAIAMLASTMASANELHDVDFSPWAITLLKSRNIEPKKIVDISFPIGFSYCEIGKSDLYSLDVLTPEQVGAIAQGDLSRVGTSRANPKVHLIQKNSPECLLTEAPLVGASFIL